MGDRWTIRDHPEWDVELIQLGRSRTLRVRRSSVLLGYCSTIPQLEQLLARYSLTTADMVELDDD